MNEPWIKFRKKLATDPRVLVMARALGVPRTQILGCLCVIWSYADDHADGRGYVRGLLPEDVDAMVELPGFCATLPPEWINISRENDALQFPKYAAHNGSTAKRRALDARRKGVSRRKSVRNGSGHVADKKRTRAGTDKTRPEERREDQNLTSADASAICGYAVEIVKLRTDRRYCGEILADFGLAGVVDALEHLASRRPSERLKGILKPAAFLKSLIQKAEAGPLTREAFAFEPFADWRSRRDAEIAKGA